MNLKTKKASVFSMEGKNRKTQVFIIIITIIGLTAASFCLGMLDLYFGAGRYKLELFFYYLKQPLIIILNTAPFILIALLLWFITGRAWIAFGIDGIICLAHSWAEYWKLMARSDPIYAADLAIISEAIDMGERYIEVTWQILLSAFLVIGGIVLFAVCFRGRLKKISVRAICALITIALTAASYFTVYENSKLYNSFKTWESLNQWLASSTFISRGNIYPFLYSIKSAAPQKPDGYDKEEAQNVLKEYDDNDIPEDEKVSVICVMYEAFADLTEYTDKIDESAYTDYHKLKSESYSGTLLTNIFAGGTIDTERCVLTGFSELTNFRRKSWSYARYFKEQGYTVQGAHAGYEGFYSRSTVNANLGFDDYLFIENHFNQMTVGVPDDDLFIADITENAKDAMKSAPVFSYNVTYQNHGPYSTDKKEFDREYITQDTVDEESWYIINNYLHGINNTCENMMIMADEFRNSEEPVVLVFFGDHKPWLGDQSGAYAALGIDINSGTEESFYNYYTTEYLIWANDAAKETLGNDFVGEGPTISPCFLMNILFRECGWEGPRWNDLCDDVMDSLPIITTNKKYSTDTTLVDEADLSQDAKEKLQTMRRVQYYLAQDAGNELKD